MATFSMRRGARPSERDCPATTQVYTGSPAAAQRKAGKHGAQASIGSCLAEPPPSRVAPGLEFARFWSARAPRDDSVHNDFARISRRTAAVPSRYAGSLLIER